jgi:peptidoglycan/LPS O-acetylase OafA/YrhL
MSDADDIERPRKKRRKKKVYREDRDTEQRNTEDRAMSYVFGALMCLLGVALLVGYYFTERAPARLFDLLAAGGVAALLSGIGLFIQPLDEERLRAFRTEPNPIAVFAVMPPFWKVWLLVILAAMIGAFIYVAQTTVRVS